MDFNIIRIGGAMHPEILSRKG